MNLFVKLLFCLFVCLKEIVKLCSCKLGFKIEKGCMISLKKIVCFRKHFVFHSGLEMVTKETAQLHQ